MSHEAEFLKNLPEERRAEALQLLREMNLTDPNDEVFRFLRVMGFFGGIMKDLSSEMKERSKLQSWTAIIGAILAGCLIQVVFTRLDWGMVPPLVLIAVFVFAIIYQQKSRKNKNC